VAHEAAHLLGRIGFDLVPGWPMPEALFFSTRPGEISPCHALISDASRLVEVRETPQGICHESTFHFSRTAAFVGRLRRDRRA
jgi:hypothetical protein